MPRRMQDKLHCCRWVRAKSLPLSILFCLSILFVQSADLIHTHEGDLQQQFDCEFCLKIGSVEDQITSVQQPMETVPAFRRDYELSNHSPHFLPVPAQVARAPPFPA